MPPGHDPHWLSYFGGVPIAPPGFEWPVVTTDDGAPLPLSFFMQIDCAAIPARGRLGLPDSGVLYLFHDSFWSGTNGFRFIHAAAPVADFVPTTPPAELPLVYHREVPRIWRWPQAVEDCPRLLPKWPFTPMLIDVPAAPDDPDDPPVDALDAYWRSGGDVKPALLAAQGPVAERPEASRSAAPQRPFPAFPQDWRAMQIAAGLMLDRLRFTFEVRDIDLPGDLSPEAKAERTDRIRAAARHWYDLAASHPPFDAMPMATAEEFWGWYSEGEAQRLASTVNREAVTLSIEASLSASAEAAARLPADALGHIAGRHSLAVQIGDTIHAPVPDRMLAVPSDVQGNEYEMPLTHLLLLEISSNEGIGHLYAEGVTQFWITPDDLATGRFDKVVMTNTGY
jgi:hypothetical protein